MSEKIVIDGIEYRLGNNDSKNWPCAYSWRDFGAEDSPPVLDRAKWQEVDLSVHLPPVYDQNGYGACNAYDTCTLIEACRAMAGMEYVRLSPGWLYGHINGQQDRGSMLEDAMAWVVRHGIPPESVIGEYAWQSSKWRGKESAAEAEARKYRALEIWRCPSFGHLASALQFGFYVSLGVMWYQNYIPDDNGWLPLRGQGSGGGHAICGYSLCRREDNSRPDKWLYGIKYRQSWGGKGRAAQDGILPETAFTDSIGGWWAARSVVTA